MIELLRGTAADAAPIAEVFLESFHATYAFPLAHSDDEVRGWVRDRLVPTYETWVAVDGGRVVAFMALLPGHLEQLYVAPDRLGTGIGRQLVDLAKQRSPEGLSLWTFQVNDRARRFYERNGFVAAEFGDGSTNQERQPDVRYEWSPSTEQPSAVTQSARSGPAASNATSRPARSLRVT